MCSVRERVGSAVNTHFGQKGLLLFLLFLQMRDDVTADHIAQLVHRRVGNAVVHAVALTGSADHALLRQ